MKMLNVYSSVSRHMKVENGIFVKRDTYARVISI